jgi:hypothetical protein
MCNHYSKGQKKEDRDDIVMLAVSKDELSDVPRAAVVARELLDMV